MLLFRFGHYVQVITYERTSCIVLRINESVLIIFDPSNNGANDQNTYIDFEKKEVFWLTDVPPGKQPQLFILTLTISIITVLFSIYLIDQQSIIDILNEGLNNI